MVLILKSLKLVIVLRKLFEDYKVLFVCLAELRLFDSLSGIKLGIGEMFLYVD